MRQSDLTHVLNSGLALHRQGRFADAERAYEQLLVHEPDHFEALHMLGVLAGQTGRSSRAVELLTRILRRNDKIASVHSNLANALMMLQRYEEAVLSYDRAIALQPDFALAYCNRGSALRLLGRLEEAVGSCEAAITLQPNLASAYNIRGQARTDLQRFDAALASYEESLALQPKAAEVYANRASVLRFLQRPEDALASSNAAIAIQPGLADAHNNRGMALHDLGLYEEALAAYERSISLRPDAASAHVNAGLNLLLRGRFTEGWELHEWRMKPGSLQSAPQFPQPRWCGVDNLNGKTLLVKSEQGLGDTIQFCRYVKFAERRGGNVVLLIQPRLRRLLKSLSSSAQIIAEGDPLPEFDFYCPLLSLPFAFNTTLETVPSETPYLEPEPERMARWRERLGDTGFRIGICWQGNSDPRVDTGRSFPLEMFRHIARIPGVRLISLQKAAGADQLHSLPAGMHVEVLDEDFDSGQDAFVDTAAVMSSLSLVVTSDTSIGHLAGALGCECWVALKQVPDWRWLLGRDDSPWYPRHRLFRQRRSGEWAPLFEAMHREIQRRISPG